MLGGVENGFGHIADIAAFSDGRFAVLDRTELRVTLFNPAGAVIRHFGRKGSGPGEFADPIALSTFGNRLVVRDSRTRAPLLLFDTTGEYVSTVTSIPAGDWKASEIRFVVARTTDAPFRMPAEDLTTRLMRLTDNAFAFVLQEVPDLNPQTEAPSPIAYLIAFDSAGIAGDTIDQATAPVDLVASHAPGRLLNQHWYAGRPLWTTGDGWLARGHGDSSAIVVRSLNGHTMLIVHLASDRAPITQHDRELFADWFYNEDVRKNTSVKWQEAIRNRLSRRRFTEMTVEATPWADLAPTATALYGDGKCLWIAGFAQDDYPTGRSLTWLAVNVETGQTRMVRIPRRGARTREFSGGYIYASYTDPFGLCTPWPDCMFQAGANWGAARGGGLGTAVLNLSAAANAASEAFGANALGAAVGNRDAVGSGFALAGMLPIGRVGKGARLLPVNEALDEAVRFLGTGYKEVSAGRFISKDGLRQVRMGIDDIMGTHAGGPHINMETKIPIPGREGRYRLEKIHIYLDGR